MHRGSNANPRLAVAGTLTICIGGGVILPQVAAQLGDRSARAMLQQLHALQLQAPTDADWHGTGTTQGRGSVGSPRVEL